MLGIEIVNFIHGAQSKGGSSQRAIEVFFSEVVQEAKIHFEQIEKNSIPLWISFQWLDHSRPKKQQKEEIVEALLASIRRSIPIAPYQDIEIGWDEFSETLLGNYLHSIRIIRLREQSESLWANVEAGYIGVEKATFESYIRNKEKDLPRYVHKFKSVWLLIIATGGAISSTVSPDQNVMPGCIESTFDRVYFFSIQDHKTILLTEDRKGG